MSYVCDLDRAPKLRQSKFGHSSANGEEDVRRTKTKMGPLFGRVPTSIGTDEDERKCEGSGERTRVSRQLLYLWQQRAEGRQKASEPGANTDARDQRIRELEKKVGELQGCIGEKTLELDFFAGALRSIEESRRRKGKSGATASTPKSAGGCNRKVD